VSSPQMQFPFPHRDTADSTGSRGGRSLLRPALQASRAAGGGGTSNENRGA
jgi:hypothetical protein